MGGPQKVGTLKITHWVPAGEDPRWPCVESWQSLETPDNIRLRFVRGLPSHNKELDTWNKVVQDFKDSGDDWLFSSHNDIILHPQTLIRLLSWDKPLVAALVFMRTAPALPHIWKEGDAGMMIRISETHEWFMHHPEYIRPGVQVMEPRPDDALTPIGFTSTSCCLIHRSVIEAMESPWFCMDTDNGGGEDRRFFQNAKKAGFQAYVDRSVIAGHLPTTIPTGALDFVMWAQMSDFVGAEDQGTVSLGK